MASRTPRRQEGAAVFRVVRRATAAICAGVAVASGLTVAASPPVLAAPVSARLSAAPSALLHIPVPVTVSASRIAAGHAVRWRLTGASAAYCTATVWDAKRTAASTICWATFDEAGPYDLRGTVRVVDARGDTVAAPTTASRTVSATEQTDAAKVSAAELDAIRRCHNRTANVQLTFDDYGNTDQIRSIVATLNRYGARGRFFFTGQWARENPTLMLHIQRNGHLVANHTSTHANLADSTDARVLREIDNGVRSTTRQPLLRPPYGAGVSTKRLNRLAVRSGHELCGWTVDTRDWQAPSVAQMVTRVRRGDATTPRVEAGGVLLMHAHAKPTAAALPAVIAAIRARGLRVEPKP